MKRDRGLRERARRLIQAGNLPGRHPDCIWAGPGLGTQCRVCGAPVKPGEVEMELEFTRDDGFEPSTFHVHSGCFSALELELASGTRSSSDRT